MADIAIRTVANTADPKRPQVEDVMVVKTKLQCDKACAERLWRVEMARSSEGWYVGKGRHEDIVATMYQRKFTRVSFDEVLVTGKGLIPFTVSKTPSVDPNTGKTVHMDVPSFVARRKASGKRVFEDPATKQLYWYGKAAQVTQADLDALWVKLITGGHTQPTRWPFTAAEKLKNVPIKSEFLTPEEAAAMAGAEEEFKIELISTISGLILDTIDDPAVTEDDWQQDQAGVLAAHGKSPAGQDQRWEGRNHLVRKRKNQVKLDQLRDMDAAKVQRAKDSRDSYDHRDDQIGDYPKTVVKAKAARSR